MKTRAAILTEMGASYPYEKSRPLKICEVELDPPKQDEVLVRIAAAGLCHSDLSVINGDRPRPMPMALGHEAAGVIEQVGPGVEDLVAGDHVVMTFMPSCGHCLPCAEGRPVVLPLLSTLSFHADRLLRLTPNCHLNKQLCSAVPC